MEKNYRYTIYLDNCDLDSIERLKVIFDYDPDFSGIYNQSSIINNNLFFADVDSEYDYTWIMENIGVEDYSGMITSIDVQLEKVIIEIVSPGKCEPLLTSILNDVTQITENVFLSADMFTTDFSECGVIVGMKGQFTFSEFSLDGIDTTLFNDENSQEIQTFYSNVENFRGVKYQEMLSTIVSPE
jgi:hypothetical protein